MKNMMPKKAKVEPELPPQPKEEDPTSQVDLMALLKSAMGEKGAKKAPAAEPTTEEESEALEGLDLSQLGFVQLSDSMSFDKNSNHGKDTDGFEEQVFIQDGDDIKGLPQDPISSKPIIPRASKKKPAKKKSRK